MRQISLVDITVSYPFSKVPANKNARMEIRAGEIHAIVGENGAGKTTLMKVLAGMYRPDSGSILIDGAEVRFRRPADASRRRIGMVHQHFSIIPGFSAAENIVFGAEPRAGGIFTTPTRSLREARDTAVRFGFSLDPSRPASELGVGERQQVEILRQLHRDCEVLILDEPTSVLTEQEIGPFFETLTSLKAKGRTIVIITHKVREVREIADRVTVMRDGMTLGSFQTGAVNDQELSNLMMGTTDGSLRVSGRPAAKPGGPDSGRTRAGGDLPLVFDDVSLARAHKGLALLSGLSFSVHPGEILGICAVSGNGLDEVEDILAGMKTPSSGKVSFFGKPYPELRKAPWTGGGMAYVPSNRMRRGVAITRPVWENFAALDRSRFFPHGFLDQKAAREAAADAIRRFRIKAEPSSPVEELSGGNIQKLILSRELSEPPPRLCVLGEPSWGLDLSATQFIYEKIQSLRDGGSAILLLSSDIDEVLSLADRILVLHRGRRAGMLIPSPELKREDLGALMLGLGASGEPHHG